MVITGGQVGKDATHTGNIHGGGYGQPTLVNGNVDVILGTRNASTGETSGNAVIYGDVYGGSALGQVNATGTVNNDNTLSNVQYKSGKKTNVTLNAGTINGSLYGGALVVIGLYFGLMYRILVIAERQEYKFSRCYAYGVLGIILFHFIINVGMVIGLMPVIGIPLPLVSYGGSGMLGFTMLLATLLKLDTQREERLF